MKRRSLFFLPVLFFIILTLMIPGRSLYGGEIPSYSDDMTEEDEALLKDILIYYGAYGEEADETVQELFRELETTDPVAARKWERIVELWRSLGNDLTINGSVLPDGLPGTDELCIIALGFQLYPDGSMKPELLERLRVVLKSARKYPNAFIVCTGGGTAPENQDVTEAGQMADYLILNGIDPDRIIVEDSSRTTAQNAVYTLDILEEEYPQVTQLAIISSNYHIPRSTLLFNAAIILRSDSEEDEAWNVVSNAACAMAGGDQSGTTLAGSLIEMMGDVDTAYQLYYDEYPIPELP